MGDPALEVFQTSVQPTISVPTNASADLLAACNILCYTIFAVYVNYTPRNGRSLLVSQYRKCRTLSDRLNETPSSLPSRKSALSCRPFNPSRAPTVPLAKHGPPPPGRSPQQGAGGFSAQARAHLPGGLARHCSRLCRSVRAGDRACRPPLHPPPRPPQKARTAAARARGGRSQGGQPPTETPQYPLQAQRRPRAQHAVIGACARERARS